MYRAIALAAAAWLAAASSPAGQGASAPSPPASGAPGTTLEEALRIAAAGHPDLRARAAEVDEARGRLAAARTLPFNPELTVGRGRRSGGGDRSTDWSWELEQEIEIAGQRGRRAALAEAELEAADARRLRAEQLLAARVALAFAEAVRARDLVAIERTDAELAASALDVARRRLDAGAGTDIEVNLATAAHARALRRSHQSAARLDAARFVLAEAMGLSPADAPSPAGDAPRGVAPPGELPDLLAIARERRADLAALRHDLRAAEARVRLARAEGAPNLRVGLFREEEAEEEIEGATLGIAIPLFDRNRGAVKESVAAEERTRWEAISLERAVEREVAESWATLRAAEATAQHLETAVVASLEENLRLLRRSFEVGKVGISEVLLFRREFLDAQRDHVDALADAWRARILVDFAQGTLRLPALEDAEP